MSILGDHAYVAGGQGGLYVVDLSRADGPVLTQTVKTTKYAYTIETLSTPFRGGVVDIAFVVEGTEGVTSYNVTRPDSVLSLEQGSDSRDAEGVFLELPEDPGRSVRRLRRRQLPRHPRSSSRTSRLPAFSATGSWAPRAATRRRSRSSTATPTWPTTRWGSRSWTCGCASLGSVKLVAYADTPGNARAIDVKDGYAYIADGLNGLVVMQVDGDATPVVVGQLPLPGLSRSIAVRANRAYIAAQDGGIHVVDVTDPARTLRLAGHDRHPLRDRRRDLEHRTRRGERQGRRGARPRRIRARLAPTRLLPRA